MTSLKHFSLSTLGAACLAGGVVISATAAFAGADDGGNKAFWSIPAPGSASGMPVQSESAAPQIRNPAAAGQPNSSIVRSGVAQSQSNGDRPTQYQAITPYGTYYQDDQQ